jgi:hypothetical protein
MANNDKDVAVLHRAFEETQEGFELAVGQWYWVLHELPDEDEDFEDEDFEDEDFEDEDFEDDDFEDDDFEDDEDDLEDEYTDKDEDEQPKAWLGCITHIGTNYAKLKGVGYERRVHLDKFDRWCTFEPDARTHIDKEVASRQAHIAELMGEVQEITERLALAPEEQLPQASQHTQALATTVIDPNEHKKALIKAKKEDLPKLFRQIEQANEGLARWMTAPTIPLKAQTYGMRKVIKHIDQRIFHVELYAGLTEEVVQVKDGKPAHKREKLKLFQRRHYMDEECLIDYKAGGMEFKSLRGFDRWLTRRKNLDRILPFPRCAVAFQVRRNTKEREFNGSLASFIRIRDKMALDKFTFLYIRNGEQVYRLRTEIEFEAKLFPDLDHSRLEGKLWVNSRDRSIIIDQNRYDGMGEDYARKKAEYERQQAEWEQAKRSFNRRDPEYKKAVEHDMRRWNNNAAGRKRAREHARETILRRRGFKKPWNTPHNEQHVYEPFDQDNVYYDDTTEAWAEALAKHNRIALILQGLFDRSPVLHPHSKARLWTAEGFEAAVELVYDDDRALAPADKPDFEAYWKKCNESLTTGSVTVGQEDVWLLHEGEKYKKQYWRDKYPPERYAPYGNPGPGLVARVEKFHPRTKKCTYAWMRERRQYRGWPHYDKPPIRTTISVEVGKVFNIDAYKPGDFKQFYADPRTRAEYLKWAVFLLTAEDYHAGKVEIGKPTPGY